MKRILSIKYNAAAFNFSMLFLRIVFGLLILSKYGYTEMVKFADLQNSFYNFMGLGSRLSLLLAIFAETICALFIVLGLFTRLAVIPLIIVMLVVIFGHDAGKPIQESELALLYLGAFVTILLCGPGRISIDGMINK
jgi:putative oxidoreductase